jgi:hypothetical protein
VAGAAFALVLTSCGGDATPTTEATLISAVDTESTATTLPVVPVTTSSTTTTLPGGPAIATEGDKNETVAAVQFLINCNGYAELTVDGSFGPATKTAVETTQTALGRAVNGQPDEETFAELSRSCAESRLLDELVPFSAVGNTSPEDPETFLIDLTTNSTLSVFVTQGADLQVTVSGIDGLLVEPVEDSMWDIETTQQYRITVTTITEPTTFKIDVDVVERVPGTGDWILSGDGFSYKGKSHELGDDAQDIIDAVYEYLGHTPRGRYNEFDTDWYEITDPQTLGLRGVSIEGLNFLFFGPSSGDPTRAESFQRLRFVGPSDDADGEPRPDDYVTTAKGITVGDNLADLKAAYGDQAKSGSNADEHFYRLSDSGGTLCFYFGANEPGDSSTITEISTECRS